MSTVIYEYDEHLPLESPIQVKLPFTKKTSGVINRVKNGWQFTPKYKEAKASKTFDRLWKCQRYIERKIKKANSINGSPKDCSECDIYCNGMCVYAP